MASLFAASYPERVRALALFHAEWQGGESDERTLQELRELRDRWGTQEYTDFLLESGCPTLAANEDDRRWVANSLRVGASPEVAYALNRAFFETDLREVLAAVRVPTLVLYREPYESIALELASRIPGAR
jgi:pimeloyl-ACP methyl ester carboxylesterase